MTIGKLRELIAGLPDYTPVEVFSIELDTLVSGSDFSIQSGEGDFHDCLEQTTLLICVD